MAKKETYKPVEGHTGIKKRLSDGMYIVTLDFGRQMKPDKKTGELMLKPVKTTRIVKTLKEAVKLREDNNRVKRRLKTSNATGKLLFRDAAEDFFKSHKGEFSDSKYSTFRSYNNRCLFYLGNMDVRNIDTLTIEKFFTWCKQDHKNETGLRPLRNVTIQKVKSYLVQLWQFMKKHKAKWHVSENVVIDAEYGKPELYKANYLKSDEYNEFLEYALKNEHDYSNIAMISLAGMAGLRRGEIAGLTWKDIDTEKKLIDIHQQRKQIRGGDVEWEIAPPKNGDPKGKTRFERRERYSALPYQLVQVLELVKKQQIAYLGKEPKHDDFVFRQKVDLVNGVLCNPRKLSTRFTQLVTRYNRVRAKQKKDPIELTHLHELRHSFVTAMINEAKIEPIRVSVNVGHIPRGSTTIEKYWHDDNNRDEIREATEKLITTKIEIPNLEQDIKRPAKEKPDGRDLRNDDL